MLPGALPFSEAPFSTLGIETVVVDPQTEFGHDLGSVGITFVPTIQRPEFGWETEGAAAAQDDIIGDPEFGWESDGPRLQQDYTRSQSARVVRAGRRSSERRIAAHPVYRRISALASDE